MINYITFWKDKFLEMGDKSMVARSWEWGDGRGKWVWLKQGDLRDSNIGTIQNLYCVTGSWTYKW